MKELKLVAKGGAFSLFGDAVNYTLSYVFLFLASRLLGADLLGAFYWALSIVGLLGEFAEAGTGQGLIYYGPKYESEHGENASLSVFSYVLRFTIRNAVVLGVLLFVLAPWISAFFHKSELAWMLQLLAVTLPFSVFWPVLYKYCVARFKIIEGISYGDISRPVIRVLFLVIFSLAGLRSFALVGTEMTVGILLSCAGAFMISRFWRNKFGNKDLDAAQKRSILLYSIPFLPLSLARGDRIILIITGFFLPVGQIGVLGVALKIAAISQVILTGLNFVFKPMVSKLYAQKKMDTLSSVYKSVTRWIFMLTLPISFILIFYSSQVMSVFGDKFSTGAAVLSIVALGYLFEFGTSATQVIINMTGKSWLSLMNQLIYFAFVFLIGVLLIPKFGITGAALAIAAGIIVINLLRLYQSWRILGFGPYSAYLAKPVAAVLLTGLPLFFLVPGSMTSGLVFTLAGFMACYAVLMVIFKIDATDLQLLAAARGRISNLFSRR